MGENTAKEAAPKAPKKSWFKGLKAEFKKIVWPDKKSLARESAAVVASAVALGIIIKVLDVVINYGLEFLMGLLDSLKGDFYVRSKLVCSSYLFRV